mgnify:CR=1 FL=1
MICYKLLITILVIFFKTGNVLSQDNIFNVNNIEITNKTNISNEDIANQAIKKAYIKLIDRILLIEDKEKISKMDFAKIKELVSYYQVISNEENTKNEDTVILNIFFDKDKLHNLFYDKNISYSEITDKEFYLLPVLSSNDQYFIFNQNFFYDRWNDFEENDLVEFILPFENIEIIKKINSNKNNLLDIEINSLFLEYSKKNQALILIEDKKGSIEKIFLRAKISGKKINKNLLIKNNFQEKEKNYREIIQRARSEIIDLVKSQNLIDIKTPSFLNIKLIADKNNNLAELHKRLNNVGLVDNLYVQEFNSEYVLLKIKYLGKLEKIINELKKERIILKQKNDEWNIKIIK